MSEGGLRLGRRILASKDRGAEGEAEYERQRAEGVGTHAAMFRLGKRILDHYDAEGQLKTADAGESSTKTTDKKPEAKKPAAKRPATKKPEMAGAGAGK